MRIIVCYDVSLVSEGGKRRLRRVAKMCVNYGLRVQNSVFECEVDWACYLDLKAALLNEIDPATDSLRIYHLGNRYRDKTEHYGVKSIPDLKEDTLLF
jgi:CRISPR-associated protein Cas2